MRTILSISLPEKLSNELEKVSKSTGRSKSDIVKESISLYLWEAKFRKIKKSLSTKAKKRGIVTEDDVFKVVS